MKSRTTGNPRFKLSGAGSEGKENGRRKCVLEFFLGALGGLCSKVFYAVVSIDLL